jgi:hypothetical protein
VSYVVCMYYLCMHISMYEIVAEISLWIKQ